MTRLWIFSDLHQDWAGNAWDPSRSGKPSWHAILASPGETAPRRSSGISRDSRAR